MCAQTIGYKGHYIHISSLAGPERIEVQIGHKDGTYHLVPARSVTHAKQIIGRIVNKRLPWVRED